MKRSAGGDGWLCVEPLWPEELAAGAVTEADRTAAAGFASARRRREFLSWRAVLYRELGHPVQVTYDPSGAPRLPVGEGFVGVSHSCGQVAVRWSPSNPCAVDIESPERDFEKVAARYLTAEERALGGACAEWLCIAWCAKECLYKLGRERGADLLRDIRLIDYRPDEGTITGSIRGRTCCLHPAGTTHRQMTDEQLKAAGVPAGLVRMSCGLESKEDLIDDIAQALAQVN